MWDINLSFLREKFQVSSFLLIVVHPTVGMVYDEIVSQPLLPFWCVFFFFLFASYIYFFKFIIIIFNFLTQK